MGLDERLDWIGLDNVEYLDFKSAREFVRSLNLKTQEEWRSYCKSQKKKLKIFRLILEELIKIVAGFLLEIG